MKTKITIMIHTEQNGEWTEDGCQVKGNKQINIFHPSADIIRPEVYKAIKNLKILITLKSLLYALY